MKVKSRPPACEEAKQRFSRYVGQLHAEGKTSEYMNGHDAAVRRLCSIVEGLALRAELSTEPGSDRTGEVLRCLLAQIERENNP